MPFVAEVGDADQTRGDVTFEWKIRDVLSLSNKMDDYYESPSFPFADTRWYLKLFPNGETQYSSEGFVGLYILRKAEGPPKAVHYTFGIKGSDRVEKKEEVVAEFLEKDKGWGFAKCWSRPTLRNRMYTLLWDNVLNVTCDLRISDALSSSKGEKKVLKSLRSVLESGDDSDVVIKVQGKEFPAHRVILRARSPVFRSMFTHHMVEKQSNIVTIDDCDPVTFSDFLVHIYSGNCEQVSKKNVYSLYTVADKYDVGELKEACAEFMKKNITVACFCDIVTLAVKHNEKELIECATKFFCEHSLEIVKTAKWQTFLAENVTLGNELIIKTLSK